jgi:hypothetical protein
MGQHYVAVTCTEHGGTYGHLVWAGTRQVGLELEPNDELALLAAALREALRSWSQGEWEFTDEC